MEIASKYNEALLQHLKAVVKVKAPSKLYKPIEYIVSLGGKRLRPILTLMTCDIFETDFEKAMNAALAVELFHNFSLIHDDIMDQAPLRRNKATVHEKWDLNTGILSGDAMLIRAYQLFEDYEPSMFRELAILFSKTAIQVCEGQQYDLDFEKRDDVALKDYIKMIDFKTAVLIGAAMKMGAIVAKAPKSCCDNIYEFGRNLGLAFQLQDDYLDTFGDEATFGKRVGGDIISNKKTFLYLTAIERGNKEEAQTLRHLFSISPKDPSGKIETVTKIFESTGASVFAQNKIEFYTQKAHTVLKKVNISEENKQLLNNFGNALMNRKV